LEIVIIPALRDNYIYLVHDEPTDTVLAIDPGEAAAVESVLAARGWRLGHILLTHHHADHIGGTSDLRRRHGARVIGATADAHRLPALDHGVTDGGTLTIGRFRIEVLAVPGHTLGHVAYRLICRDGTAETPHSAEALFCGDTLFSLGCGRLFEGTPEQMWESLCRLRALPDTTTVYCGHEYTESNGRFAAMVDPGNRALQARLVEVAALRRAGRPSLPTFLACERQCNPFLRADDATLASALGLSGAVPVKVFAALRRRKDQC